MHCIFLYGGEIQPHGIQLNFFFLGGGPIAKGKLEHERNKVAWITTVTRLVVQGAQRAYCKIIASPSLTLVVSKA
jgi:hypothetical protein